MNAKRFFDERLNYVPNEYGTRPAHETCNFCGTHVWALRAKPDHAGCVFCRKSHGRSPIQFVDRELTADEQAQNEAVREWARLSSERDAWFRNQPAYSRKPFPHEARFKELSE